MARTLAMFTDVSLCIGCRACQVACKQWNQLAPEEPEWTGTYQNHHHFTDKSYRLVRFFEETDDKGQIKQWHMMSDVCKHCAQAGCLEACPTGAIYRTEYGTVNINQDICNGCRYCVSACPFGVVAFNHDTGTATKCTFCNDRIHNGLGPACAKACPTESIRFGFRDELAGKAKQRVEELKKLGYNDAQLYGEDTNGALGGLNAFFLLLGKPSIYGLPDKPKLPQRNVITDSLLSIGSALLVGLGALMAFSPMSAGAWALLGFGACAFLVTLDVFLEDRGGRSMSTLRVVAGVIGGFFGFFLAAYPGVLLGATARPLFINAHWLGALFLAIGASTGGAAIAFVLSLSGGQRGDALSRLMRFTAFALIVQLAALALFMLTVSTSGSAGIARSLSHLVAGPYGVPFWLGAVVIGIVVPLALQFAGVIRKTAPGMTALVAVLILVGGFIVKYVIIAAGQAT